LGQAAICQHSTLSNLMLDVKQKSCEDQYFMSV